MIKQISGSQMISEALHEEGVEIVFGYPGGAALNIYDETYKQTYFKHVLVRHEQAAVHAADGYARVSGKVGVAFVTSGPGFTNAVTGLATAYSDSIPVVLISGQVPTFMIGTDAFQEIDAVGISRPCVKHNFLVNSVEELPRIIKGRFTSQDQAAQDQFISISQKTSLQGLATLSIQKKFLSQATNRHIKATLSR